jgi:hypothetical protein
MDDRLERLAHVLRSLAERAKEMADSGMTAGYQAVGRVFNDYIRLAREHGGAELVNRPIELEVPAAGEDLSGFLGELAVGAAQLADELEYVLESRVGQEQADDAVDWADAIVRLTSAGVDADDALDYVARSSRPGGKIARHAIERLIKLADAGVDLDDVFHRLPVLEPSRFERRGRPQRPFGAAECAGRKEQTRGGGSPEERGALREASWKMEVLSRVEKGEIGPEDGAALLRSDRPAKGPEDSDL